MSKVVFEFDGNEEPYDITLCTHRVDLAVMLENVNEYARELTKYESRAEIPVEEVAQKLSDIIQEWYYISDV